uniref:Uncharacterized protein n=1 Tax=Octopus bimaculoides TaxID=37653 RepID=A0A0L8HQR3_OCTBM
MLHLVSLPHKLPDSLPFYFILFTGLCPQKFQISYNSLSLAKVIYISNQSLTRLHHRRSLS